MKQTLIAKYHYPEDPDPPDGPSQISQLAREFDITTIPKFTSTVDRDAAFPTPVDKQMAYLTSTDLFQVYNGTTRVWDEFTFSPPGKSTWTSLTPSYNSNFVDYGGVWLGGAYTKDALGQVHLRGLVKNKTTGTLPSYAPMLATPLPVGFRPSGTLSWVSERALKAWVQIRVDAAGQITLIEQLAANQYVFLDVVHYFPA